MQGPDYIFAFQNQDYKFWKKVSGNITIDSQHYFLKYAPSGWQEISVENVRNKRYWGIDRSVTVPLTYVQDGAEILKYITLNKGTEEKVFLTVLEQQLDYQAGVGYMFWYKQRSRLEVDLTTLSHEGSSVKVTLLEDGLAKYLKANENTTFEIALNNSNSILVKMDGIKLHQKLNYTDGTGFDIEKNSNGDNFLGPAVFLDKEGDSVGVVVNSQQLEDVTGQSFDDKKIKTNCIIENANDYAIDVVITGRIEFTCTSNTSTPHWAMKFRFLRSGQLSANQNDYEIISTVAMVVGTTYGSDINVTVPLQPGERLSREGIFFGGVGANAAITFTENSKFHVSFVSRYKTTYVRAFTAQYLFEQYIDKVSEGTHSAVVSAYFQKYANVVFTCGNGLRGFDDAVFKWSWSGFFQFFDSFDSVGISVVGTTVDFNSKDKLIDTANVIALGEPSNFKWSFARDMFFNELEIGYPELKNDIGVLNGNEEFNTKYLFSMGMMKKPGKMEKVSEIAAGCYPIEKIRVTTVNKETTDYKNDNDVFPLYINLTPQESGGLPMFIYYNLDRSLNASSTGLTEPDTVFNMPLSPKLNFKRNGPWIRSCTWLTDYKNLEYRTADKNNALTFTDPVYGPIIEKENENIGSLGSQFVVPILFYITVPAPDNLIELLDVNPLQVYSFILKGETYKGILIECSTGLAAHNARNYILQALPDNNFKKLQNYNG